MDTKRAYNIWSSQYDSTANKTREFEAIALRENLLNIPCNACLEIGCGTGKNTLWLFENAGYVAAVDFSNEMLAKAKEKILSDKVEIIQAENHEDWSFAESLYDLITFSLVLEHVENLDHIFKEASRLIKNGGHIYIGELHPFRQYSGSKARFENGDGMQIVDCFTHHISDFVEAAKKYDLRVLDLKEYFDNKDKTSIPRIITIMLMKP